MLTFIQALLPASFAPVVVLPHGYVWFLISVFIFVLGRIVPALQVKPPPLVQKLRKARRHSPRHGSANIKSAPEQPEDRSSTSVKFAPALQRSATMAVPPSSSPFKRPVFKSIFSFAPGHSTANPEPHAASTLHERAFAPVLRRAATLSEAFSTPKMPTLKSMRSFSPTLRSARAVPSPRTSVSSESDSDSDSDSENESETGPDHSGLPTISSPTSSTQGTYSEGDSPSPAPASLPSSSGSPRPTRSGPLASLKMFRSLSRRVSTKQFVLRPSTPGARSVDDDSELQVVSDDDGHRDNTMLGDVFITKFVDPFRVKNRNADSVKRAAPMSPLSPRRASLSRRMLASLHLGHSDDSRDSSISDSPRSSISSVSTGCSCDTTPSSSCSPRSSLSRTEPYNATHPATPVPASQGWSSSRRATSMSLVRPATVAEESAEEAELEKDCDCSTKAETVPPPQRQPVFRHRTTASGAKWSSF
ncbi:hypothetical protein OH76DRAFT_816256 [Lentinus brumalis]|uniref:Uncharacterized protein n=1 Tax=Lentinus brumalis TaxID=2498619 RepID=A0A371D2Q5_9APHY|nr:hypothetical protein OH76DRAFT_816256 [Polyporus brumalis]